MIHVKCFNYLHILLFEDLKSLDQWPPPPFPALYLVETYLASSRSYRIGTSFITLLPPSEVIVGM